jgi:hypothetical protein
MSVLSQFVGANPTGDLTLTISTDTFSIQSLASDLGSWSSGGHVICKASSTAWIVAPGCSEVSRTWYCIDDAVTTANACATPFTGWFVPTISQLQNPGYTCRTYWDLFSSARYWSSTEYTATNACPLLFTNGNTFTRNKTEAHCVRSFRCVTY